MGWSVAGRPTRLPQGSIRGAVMDSVESPQERGALVSQLSREIVQLHARLYGRGPVKARSYLQRGPLLCVLEEIFTTAERTLIATGSGMHVRKPRLRFQDGVRDWMVRFAE